MSTPLGLEVAAQAVAQIEQAAEWWRLNRTKAPDAVFEELARAFELITHEPWAGLKQPHLRLRELRRLFLVRIRMYLYYHVVENPRRVEVLALWHASRREAPQL